MPHIHNYRGRMNYTAQRCPAAVGEPATYRAWLGHSSRRVQWTEGSHAAIITSLLHQEVIGSLSRKDGKELDLDTVLAGLLELKNVHVEEINIDITV